MRILTTADSGLVFHRIERGNHTVNKIEYPLLTRMVRFVTSSVGSLPRAKKFSIRGLASPMPASKGTWCISVPTRSSVSVHCFDSAARRALQASCCIGPDRRVTLSEQLLPTGYARGSLPTKMDKLAYAKVNLVWFSTLTNVSYPSRAIVIRVQSHRVISGDL